MGDCVLSINVVLKLALARRDGHFGFLLGQRHGCLGVLPVCFCLSDGHHVIRLCQAQPPFVEDVDQWDFSLNRLRHNQVFHFCANIGVALLARSVVQKSLNTLEPKSRTLDSNLGSNLGANLGSNLSSNLGSNLGSNL